MKLFLALASVACLGTVLCDQPQTSSYAVLPYENEIHHHQAPHGGHDSAYSQPYYDQGYYDYDGGNDKKKFSFGGMMKAPMKAIRGAGNYMRDMFDDVTSKFQELRGSILKAQGSFFTAHGQNVLTKAYKKKAKQNILYPVEYYNPAPQPYHTPSYAPQPHGSAYTAINPHDQYESHKSHPEPAYSAQSGIIESGHNVHGGAPAGHKTIDHGVHGKGTAAHVNVGEHSAHQSVPQHSALQHNVVPSESSYATVPHQRREFIEQRSSRRRGGNSGRTQRAYSFGPIDHPYPIPVPVPFRVQPFRLVMPSVPGIGHQGGY